MRKIFRTVQSRNCAIKTLDLSDNLIRDEDIAIFVCMWNTDSLIEALILNENLISPGGAQLLLKAAASHLAFSKLSLESSDMLGYDGLRMIGEELSSNRLIDLNINSCMIERMPASKDLACQALAKGLSESETIQNFSCINNDLSADGLKMILRAAKNHPSLRCMHLGLRSVTCFRVVGMELPSILSSPLRRT